MASVAKAQTPLFIELSFGRALWGWFTALLAFLFFFPTIILLNLLQVLSLLVLPFSRAAFRKINRWCANTWWGWCVIGAEKVFGVEPIFSGDDVPCLENALVFANHQQMPDIVVVMMLAYRKGRLGDMKWFVKDPLKYVPGIGWGMLFLDCLFVKRDWLADKHRILKTFEKFFQDRIPIWLVTFVEGTRFTPAKLARSQQYAARKNWPTPRHVMIPKTRGFTAAVEGLSGHIQAVYDITIGYDGGIPRLHHIVRGMVKRVYIDVRRFPIEQLPKTEIERAVWLRERFVRKDEALDVFFKTGRFPK